MSSADADPPTVGADQPTVIGVDEPERADAEPDWDDQINRVGRYVLLERLGEGAFGVVRAAYDPELERKVAIKLLRSDVGRGSVSSDPEDLLEEARMNAKLSHPNVVAVYDVGRLSDAVRYAHRERRDFDGIYIVMEHLGGPSLVEWLEQKRDGGHALEASASVSSMVRSFGSLASASSSMLALVRPNSERRRPWTELLEVFMAAGRGLAAAHALGMVHRDFKPQNLRFGDDGRIRVLDFGLARLARQLARASKISGTPLFMPPEQLRGDQTDARSDQYAFCVSLWLALYNDFPFSGSSTVELTQLKQQPPTVPSNTDVPGWIGALLRRGLDPDPQQRFANMDELLALLADDPIQRRRRRVGVAGVAVALLGLGFGLSKLDGGGTDPCALPSDHFAGMWDADARALIEQRFDRADLPYAKPALELVAGTFDTYVADWSGQRVEACQASVQRAERSIDEASLVIECLDRQLQRFAAMSQSFQRAEDATILHAADILSELPKPGACRDRAAARLAARSLAAGSGGSIELERALMEANAKHKTGEYRAAIELADQVIAEARELGDASMQARALSARASAYLGEHQFDDALASAQESYALAVEADDELSVASALVRLVEVYRHKGDYDRADVVVSLADDVVARVGSEQQIAFVFARGLLDVDAKRWDEAIARLDEAHALAESYYGPAHLEVGLIELSRGIANSASHRDFDAALIHFDNALQIFRRNYGDVHPRIASCYNNIGGVHFRRSNPAAAAPQFERAREVYESIYGPDHPQTMRALTNLGAAEYLRGNTKRAIELTERTLEIRGKSEGRDSPGYLTAEDNLAAMYFEHGQPLAARPLLEHVYQRTVEIHGADAPPTIAAAGALTTLAITLDDDALFERYAEVVRTGYATLADDTPDLAEILGHVYSLRAHTEQWSEALAAAERLVALRREVAGEQSVQTALEVRLVGAALHALGRDDEAHTRLLAALAVLEADAERDPVRDVSLLLTLAKVELALGERESARGRYLTALARMTSSERSPDTAAEAHLGLARMSSGDERAEHARAALELLEPLAYAKQDLAEARELLGMPASDTMP